MLDYGGRDRTEVKAVLASRRFVRLTNGIEWVHENLLHFVKVKHFAQQLGVISVVREGARGVMKMTPKARVDPNKLLALIQDNPNIKFSPNGVLSFPIKAHGTEVIDAIEELLKAIA